MPPLAPGRPGGCTKPSTPKRGPINPCCCCWSEWTLKFPVNCGRRPPPRPINAPLPLRPPLHAPSRLTKFLASSTRTLSATQHTYHYQTRQLHTFTQGFTPLSEPFHSTHTYSLLQYFMVRKSFRLNTSLQYMSSASTQESIHNEFTATAVQIHVPHCYLKLWKILSSGISDCVVQQNSYWTIWWYITEYHTLHICCCEKFKHDINVWRLKSTNILRYANFSFCFLWC